LHHGFLLIKKTIVMRNVFIIIICLSLVFQDLRSQEPTTNPDRIMLSIPGNPATTRAVSWRTSFEDTVSLGEIALVNAAPVLEKYKITVTGTFAPWEDNSQLAMGHKVIFENLEPGTKYAYRVGNGVNWSEWFHFITSSDSIKPFSFLYFGDVQSNIKSYGSRILRQAYSHFPEADFMLFAGDLVNRSEENYWSDFFYAGSWIFGTMPVIATPGNHEYYPQKDQPRTFSRHWNQIFTFPKNGPSEKFNNRYYYIDYQGVRFISVDAFSLESQSKADKSILTWLDKVLSENPCRWTVVFAHYPVYSCSQGRNSANYRNIIKPVLEKHGVDITLHGHDHTYCRGQNLPEAGENLKNYPVYVVSVAGPQMYGLNTSFWSDRVASNTQLYQHITFNGDTLHFKAFTVTGDLYDEFVLIKDKNGINRFIESEKVKDIKQRTEILESNVNRYTDEELERYRERFK